MVETFTNEELLAYAEERLPASRASVVEQELRSSAKLLLRLTQLIQEVDRGDVSLGAMWRRGRWSCPPRAVWAAFVAGRLGDALSQHLRFHVETIGCRLCEASLRDLQQGDSEEVAQSRVRKIFQSSAGGLKPNSNE